VSLGAGTSYDLLGVRLEAGSNHWSAFVGIGALAAGLLTGDTNTAPGGYGFSAGARWYRGVREGLFVSLNFTDIRYNEVSDDDAVGEPNAATSPASLATFTAVWAIAGA
jgi:hypothetical protein